MGVIDAGYRGEIQVILLPFGPRNVLIRPGDKIAQLVIIQIHAGQPAIVPRLEDLGVTERGATGFGSTGRA
jgi:dUTP pyrophosphatase